MKNRKGCLVRKRTSHYIKMETRMRKLLRVFSCYVWQTMSNSLWQRAVNNGLFSSQVVSWRLLWNFNTLVQRLRVILLFCSEQITRSLFLMLVFLCHGIVYVLAALNSPMPNAVNASDKTGSNKNDVANKCWKQVMAEVECLSTSQVMMKQPYVGFCAS